MTDQGQVRLSVEGITRAFQGREVVSAVGFTVAAGQVVCLLGPSGCGKSTTLRIIAGVDSPDAGIIRIDGRVMTDAATEVPPEARSVGMMFQDFALFPHLSVADNVGFGLSGPRPARAARVAELLDRIGLAGLAGAYPHELSGGEAQRVALARAVAPRPRVMLMDEPFSGLDERLKDDIRDHTLAVLKEEGTAVVLVTHEPDEAMRMADEILLMRDGRIVQRGAPYHVYTAPVDRDAAAFFSDINVIHGEVHGALTDTPFGEFLAPGHAEGACVEIVIRPQHLKIDFDRGGRGPLPTPEDGTPARGVVERARFMGRESLVEFRMDHDGSLLQRHGAAGLPAETGHAPVADDPPRPLLRVPRLIPLSCRPALEHSGRDSRRGLALLVGEAFARRFQPGHPVDPEHAEILAQLAPGGQRPEPAPVFHLQRPHDALGRRLVERRDSVRRSFCRARIAARIAGMWTKPRAASANGKTANPQPAGGRGAVLAAAPRRSSPPAPRGGLQFAVGHLGHHRNAQVQRLQLGLGQVQRRQGDRRGHPVAGPARALRPARPRPQRLHVAPDRAGRDLAAARPCRGRGAGGRRAGSGSARTGGRCGACVEPSARGRLRQGHSRQLGPGSASTRANCAAGLPAGADSLKRRLPPAATDINLSVEVRRRRECEKTA